MGKTNLKALSKEALEEFVKSRGLPPYRAGQLIRWIYERRAGSIEEITELSKGLRERLSGEAYISNLDVLDRKTAHDGTEKFLFGLEDGLRIESVLIPDEQCHACEEEGPYEEGRLTLCVSSQVGCAMGCRFCLTGRLKLRRSLLAYEIADQLVSAGRIILPGRISNVVFMGMGEPLQNLDEVSEAIRRMTGFMKMSKRRITVSTSGVAPKILELSRKAPLVNLAVSLNATTDRIRDMLMPINRKYPLGELFCALRKYPLPKRRRITFEYVLLSGVNDSPEDALRLVGLLKGLPSKVNLIAFNEYEGCDFRRPSEEAVLGFQKVLTERGLTALIRKSKGAEIMAACGQLAGGYSL